MPLEEDNTGTCQTPDNYVIPPVRDIGNNGDKMPQGYDSIDIAEGEVSGMLQNKIQTLKSDPQYKQILAELVKDSIQTKHLEKPERNQVMNWEIVM